MKIDLLLNGDSISQIWQGAHETLAPAMTVIVVGNVIGDRNSNPGCDSLNYYTLTNHRLYFTSDTVFDRCYS